MRRIFTAVLAILSFALVARGGRLDLGSTLRADYIFSGTDTTASIALDCLSRFDSWAGRRVNMSEVPLRGNGQILMRACSDGEILYAQAFSTLFQEWQATEEATATIRSFENVFLLPMPSERVDVTVELYDFHGRVTASLTHTVDPGDILIRRIGQHPTQYEYLLRSGESDECIDVAIVAEGYTEDQMDIFRADAASAVESILSHEPFSSMKDRFNFIAVLSPSKESGVSVPREGKWSDTACLSHFDTFYMDRYLTTLNLKRLHDLLAGLPYEHIVILANTDTYGGGGIFNSYTLTTAHHPLFKPVVVHEFGHSFAGLADEYYYDDMYTEYYYPDIEPWEQNITTRADFSSKWEDMTGRCGVGLYEGGGYQSKGVWRPSRNCRMKANSARGFCPVCRRAIERIIDFYTDGQSTADSGTLQR